MARAKVLGCIATCFVVGCGAFSSDAPGPAPAPDANADADAATMMSGGGTEAGADAARQPAVGAPPGCDPSMPPQNSPPCVVDEFGIFVDPTAGNDAQPGTKAAPAKTITGALAKIGGRRRLYLCDGVLDEHVKLTDAVDLYGGFACQTWAYTGTKVRVAPQDPGYALDIRGVTGAMIIADMDLSAVAGTAASPSSVAAIVKTSPMVTLRRVALTAKAGFDRPPGATGDVGALTLGSPGGACTCTSGGTSHGGPGGPKGGIGAPSNPGSAGGVAQANPTPAGATGAGASAGSPGTRGSDANGVATNGAGANHTYDLVGDDLVAAAGQDGGDGPTAQGGGGSASTVGLNAATPSLPGRGGGCGGCGGRKGAGGLGGGASIALLGFDAPVVLDTCTLTSGNGGHGGNGGAGGPGGAGQAGAPADASQSTSRNGGDGGNGGAGGGGGGGAGGATAGIVYKGAVVVVQATTKIATGTVGAKGTGGVPGVNDGVDGPKADTIVLQ